MWREWLNRIFPVRVDREADVLRIHDRRPSDAFLLSVTIVAGSLFISAMIARPSLSIGIYWPLLLLLLPAPIFGVKSLMSPISATHVFDKPRGVYSLTVRTVLKKQTTEGDMSQVRGVQVERRVTTNTEQVGTTETYRAVLLLKQGLLFGSPDIVPLREHSALGSYYETETQIASAISGYLALDVAQLVDL